MRTAQTCPKCNFSAATPFSDCPRCGLIISKFLQRKKEQKQFEDRETLEKKSSLDRFAATNVLIIRQQKEWGEILTGFETKNKYAVLDHRGNPLFEAEEEGGSMATILTRFFLTALRPFTMHLFSKEGTGLFKLKRPFRFYFHELDISRSNGAPLGKIKRRFSILRRIYSVLDRNDNEIFQLFGPILHPWTFQIKKGSQQIGKITKKWSGLLKEAISDADNFGITFPKGIELSQKAILLGAVFLIDFVHFENQGNRD
jgi:uncharacterized protein YxjI